MPRRFAVFAAALVLPGSAAAAPGDSCRTRECRDHIRTEIRARWRKEAAPFREWIRKTTQCESGSSGHYHLTTTGNGFWFAAQYTASTWRSVGGRLVAGVPHGVWAKLPDQAEQDARMVRVRKSQGTGAWPNCLLGILKAMQDARIPLGGRRGPIQGYAIVDAADVELVADRLWYLDSQGYPQTAEGKKRYRMHTFLMRPPKGMEVDHRDGNKLNNRRSNMQVVTHAENAQNVRTAKGDMRGVYLHPNERRAKRWYGQVKHMGKKHCTSMFATQEEARVAVAALREQILPNANGRH